MKVDMKPVYSLVLLRVGAQSCSSRIARRSSDDFTRQRRASDTVNCRVIRESLAPVPHDPVTRTVTVTFGRIHTEQLSSAQLSGFERVTEIRC